MLLSILFHLFLDEAKSAIDNLLVKLQFSFLLIQILLRPPDLNRVEIEQLILLLEDFQNALSLDTFVKDLVLDASRDLDLLKIFRLHLLGLLLDLTDLLIKDIYFLLCLFLLFSYFVFDINFILAFLSNQSIKFLNLALIVFILLVSFANNLIFLVNRALHM